MTFPWRCLCRPRRSVAVIVAFACANATVACGPEFPNSYYGLPESALLAAPEGIFAAEIARIAEGIDAPAQAVKEKQATAEVERRELRRALAEQGVEPRRAQEIEARFAECRAAVDEALAAAAMERRRHEGQQGYGSPGNFTVPALPAGLPREFADYFNGAVAWHRGDLQAAREHWAAVLALPAGQRGYRSVWAAFMMGRAWAKDAEHSYTETAKKVAEAQRCFARVRELAASFPDPLGLAAESIGWEARCRLRSGDEAGAIELYLQHYASGDATALDSLRVAARWASSGDDRRLDKLAASPRARRVLTAYFISRGEPRWSENPVRPDEARWVGTLRRAGVRDVPEADRMAWLAYEAGAFPLAWEWLALARDDVPEVHWLRAKLALRGGDLQAGEKHLRAALASPLDEAHRPRVAAELSRVCLARDDFAGALSASLQGGHWEDAAFVAERVMTADELIGFIEAKPIVPVLTDRWFGGHDSGDLLRHLLARRLARMGRFTAAETYFPAAWQLGFRTYVADTQIGFDSTRTAEVRAAAFWRAAVAIREHGMELLGTELEPDWAIWNGYYDEGRSVDRRRGKGEQPPRRESIFQPSPLEAQRLGEQRAPQKRFHYRYRAAELAWWAASLLPNDSDQTAEILATAGGWLKNRDPEAAKPFYQALVIRCGNTTLGRAAAVKRWFPEAAKPADADVGTREL